MKDNLFGDSIASIYICGGFAGDITSDSETSDLSR